MNPKCPTGKPLCHPAYRDAVTLGCPPGQARALSWEDRQAPRALNGSLRLGLPIALNDEVIRPWPEPAKNWDHRARQRTGTSPPFRVNGWGQGEPECFLGHRRTFDAAVPRQVGPSGLTCPLPSPYGCLVGRPVNRIQVGTRHSKMEKSGRKKIRYRDVLCLSPGGLNGC